ncbi:MAG: ABC transporter substrate-binding protein, partial [Bradyrhizobium sp.]
MKAVRLMPAAALAILAAGFGAAPASADNTVKIGVAVALTGPLAPYEETEGARCMADKLNKAAGPNDPKIEVLTADNRSDAQLSVSLGQKFLDDGDQVIAG